MKLRSLFLLLGGLALPVMGEVPEDPLRALSGSIAAKAGSAMTVAGSDGWLFLTNELRHLGAGVFWGPEAAKVSRAARPQDADPLPAILDFQKQLAAAGIELVMVPVPPKALVHADRLVPAAKMPSPSATALGQFHELLRSKGVAVLDLTADFAEASAAGRDPYCRQDSHWSGLGCELAAKKIAEMIRAKPWYAGLPRGEFSRKEITVTMSGDLWSALPEAGRPGQEVLELQVVAGKDGKAVPPDRASPVILMGDSHNLVFHAGGDMHATGAGLPDQLAAELGWAVDLIAVRGSGATPARINLYRNGQSDPAYLGRKKMVIWCFTAREYTEAQGWRLVPLRK